MSFARPPVSSRVLLDQSIRAYFCLTLTHARAARALLPAVPRVLRPPPGAVLYGLTPPPPLPTHHAAAAVLPPHHIAPTACRVRYLSHNAVLAVSDVEVATRRGAADAAQGRQQDGPIRRVPQPPRPAQALPGTGVARWQEGEPGHLRHRRGSGAVHRTDAGGAGGGGAACGASAAVNAVAARSAAACPSGDRATYSAASSAVAKLPRCTVLPPRFTCAR